MKYEIGQKDQNFEPIFEKEKIKDKFFDEISIPDDLVERNQNNCNHRNNLNDLISNIFKAMNSQDKFEIVDDDLSESDMDNEIVDDLKNEIINIIIMQN